MYWPIQEGWRNNHQWYYYYTWRGLRARKKYMTIKCDLHNTSLNNTNNYLHYKKSLRYWYVIYNIIYRAYAEHRHILPHNLVLKLHNTHLVTLSDKYTLHKFDEAYDLNPWRKGKVFLLIFSRALFTSFFQRFFSFWNEYNIYIWSVKIKYQNISLK